MEKNQKILLCIISVLIVIFGVIGFLAYKNEKNKPIEKINKFKEEYELLNGTVNDEGYTYPTVEIDNTNAFKYASKDNVLDILEHGNKIIFFGLKTDPYSRNIVKALNAAAQSTDTKKIYYLDITDFRDILRATDDGEIEVEYEGHPNYKEVLEKLDSILEEYYIYNSGDEKIDALEKRIDIPLVVTLSDGEILDYHFKTVETHINLDNPYTELTKEEEEELYSIFVSMMVKLNESTCDEGNKGC